MKLLTKIALVVATLTALGTSAALADDQQLEQRLVREQAQNASRTTTVAVYADHRGVSRAEAPANDAAHYEVHLNGHSIPIGS